MDLDYHSWLPLSGHSNWYLLGLSTGTLSTTHCLLLKVKDVFIVVFPPQNTWRTSLVPPQRLRRWAIWSRERGHITQAHRHEITASVCLSHPHKVCVCFCLCAPLADRNRVGNYSGTNLMKTLFIWCYSLSYQFLTGYQRGWWIVFPSERKGRRGRDVFLLPLFCVLLWVGCSTQWVFKKFYSNHQWWSASLFIFHSSSWRNNRIIN